LNISRDLASSFLAKARRSSQILATSEASSFEPFVDVEVAPAALRPLRPPLKAAGTSPWLASLPVATSVELTTASFGRVDETVAQRGDFFLGGGAVAVRPAVVVVVLPACEATPLSVAVCPVPVILPNQESEGGLPLGVKETQPFPVVDFEPTAVDCVGSFAFFCALPNDGGFRGPFAGCACAASARAPAFAWAVP
jgi:hypothetical protein